MRKKISLFIFVFVFFFFVLIFIMLGFDNKYNKDIYNDIYENTDIENIEYVNEYDNYYIVIDDKYLYLISSDYVIITKIDLYLIHDNTNNYDIIYKDGNLMYLNDYKDDLGVVFEYYDIYKYELVDKIVVGGKYE